MARLDTAFRNPVPEGAENRERAGGSLATRFGMSIFREARREGSALVGVGLAGHPSTILHQMSSRLATLQRPNLLDLGPLCGLNIEYFASRGCRVFVEAAEDLRRLPRRAPTPKATAPVKTAEPGRGAGPGRVNPERAAGPPKVVVSARERPTLRPWQRPAVRPLQQREWASLPGAAWPLDPPAVPAAAPTHVNGDSGGPKSISLTYPDGHFDVILLWDVMDYLLEEPARELGHELLRVSRPGGFLYLFSDARKKAAPEPLLRYRLGSDDVVGLEVTSGSPLDRIPRENRELYRLFDGFQVVKSTLLRNQLREVLLQQGS